MTPIREVLHTIVQKTSWLVSLLSLIIAGIALWLMMGLIVSEVIARNAFSYGIPFTTEYAEYMVPAFGVVGAAYCLSKGGHIRVVVLIDRVPRRIREWINVLGLVLGLVFLIVFAIQAFTIALINIATKVKAYYPTQTPLGYPQLILGIGLSLFALGLVIEISRKARLLPLDFHFGNKNK